MGAVVMTLSLKQQLSEQGYYWYNIPKSAGFPFLAVVEHTNFVSAGAFRRRPHRLLSATTWRPTTSTSR